MSLTAKVEIKTTKIAACSAVRRKMHAESKTHVVRQWFYQKWYIISYIILYDMHTYYALEQNSLDYLPVES